MPLRSQTILALFLAFVGAVETAVILAALALALFDAYAPIWLVYNFEVFVAGIAAGTAGLAGFAVFLVMRLFRPGTANPDARFYAHPERE